MFLVKRRKISNGNKNKEVSNKKQNFENSTPHQQKQESRHTNTNVDLNSSEVSPKKIQIKFKSKPTKVKNEMELRENELNISPVEINTNKVKPMSASTKESKINKSKNNLIVVESKSKKLIRLYFIGKNDIQKFSKNQFNSNVLENKALKTDTTEIPFLNKPVKALNQLNNMPDQERVLDKKKNLLNESDNLGETKKIETSSFVNMFF